MKLIVGLSWIGSLVVAFFLGQYFNLQWSGDPVVHLLDVKKNRSSPAVANEMQIKGRQATISRSSHSDFVTPSTESVKEIVELVTALSGSEFDLNFSGLAKAYQHIEDMTEDELIEALYISLNKQGAAENNAASMMFLNRYAEMNPGAATGFAVLNFGNRRQKALAIKATLNIWSEQNPQGAYSWYKTNQSDLRDGAADLPLVPIFSGLAKEGLSNAINKLSELSSNSTGLNMAVVGIANTLSDASEYQVLMDNVQNFDNDRVVESALSAWSLNEPQDAAAWLERQGDRSQSERLIMPLLKNWLHNEPDQAADWYMNYYTEASLQAKVETLVQTMSYSSPEDALTWLKKQTNVDFAEPTTFLLNQAARFNPGFSKENLYLIKDKEENITVSHSIYQGLQRISQAKAEAFLAESPVRNELVKLIEGLKVTNIKLSQSEKRC
jgi:hypothetical protein